MIPHSRPDVSDNEIKVVVAALKKRHMAQGLEVQKLEKQLSRMYNGAEVVAVSSGTAALYLALLAIGAKPGRQVIMPSYTCNSLYAAVNLTGATAACADVAENSVNINRSTIQPLLERKTVALIIPHMFGFLSDVGSIRKLGIPVIEDCAQAVGGRYPDGSLTGTKGDVAVLSFYATKLIPAGEGGACITRNHRIAEFIRNHRDCDKQMPLEKAFNFKMTDISAALATTKLKSLRSNIRQRAVIAGEYTRSFSESSFKSSSANHQVVHFRYLLKVNKNAASLIGNARKSGIGCSKPVWMPLHHSLGGKCPLVEELEKSMISIPLYPGLTVKERKRICDIVTKLLPGQIDGNEDVVKQ